MKSACLHVYIYIVYTFVLGRYFCLEYFKNQQNYWKIREI